MHICEDHFYPEIIDPETGEVLPEGSKGELVFTSLDKEAFPLLRYRTKDICVLSRKPCSCGRTLVKMSKPLGRSDDMLIIRGVNVFPSQIETVLLNHGYEANYQIFVDRVNNTDTLDVNVERKPDMGSDLDDMGDFLGGGGGGAEPHRRRTARTASRIRRIPAGGAGSRV